MPRDSAAKSPVQNVNSLTLAFANAVGRTQQDKSDNLVVSPYNALTALAMAAKAADGNTRQEMAQTLFGVDAGELDAAFLALAALNTQILEANKDQVTLKTANGIWTNKDLSALNQKLADVLKQEFGAEISAEDFKDPATVAKINAWAASNTNNLIDSIIDKLGAQDYAILASALYFKGDWTHKFDKALTEDRVFGSGLPGGYKTPTMKQEFKEGDVRYQKGKDYEAVELTYGEQNWEDRKSPTMRLVLVRPTDKDVSARDWLAKQNGTDAQWLNGYFEKAEGTVELPRIDIKQKHDLIPALQVLGIHDAFTGRADFSGLTEDKTGLTIGKVTQDVVFKTNEEGSEAAAVTTIEFECTSIQFPKKIDVKFDRSFVLALQDIKTGAVLFVGAINKPNNEMKPIPAVCFDAKPPKGPSK